MRSIGDLARRVLQDAWVAKSKRFACRRDASKIHESIGVRAGETRGTNHRIAADCATPITVSQMPSGNRRMIATNSSGGPNGLATIAADLRTLTAQRAHGGASLAKFSLAKGPW